MKKFLLVVCMAIVAGIGWYVWTNDTAPQSNKAKQTQQAFDTKQHSLEDPTSPWVIVNKHRPLQPTNYTPTDLVTPNVRLRLANEDEMQLRKGTATAVAAMFAGAKQDGLELMVASAYRSYAYQDGLYATYVRQQGQTTADTQSARPGYSEHQTGLAVDIEPASRECEVEQCFADLPEGQWIAAHAHEYGFIIRYPKNKETTTGYIYEPWHLRYVGKSLAQELRKQGNPTLEEFFGLDPAPDYQ
jgi:D-alanyl-D-alanine carboxypeptidase